MQNLDYVEPSSVTNSVASTPPKAAQRSRSCREAIFAGHASHTEPVETLERLLRIAPEMGISRVANITGLDEIGIPVAAAIRPNSRNISVSQGKGLDMVAAKVSR